MNLDNYINIYNYLSSSTLPDNLSMEQRKRLIQTTRPYFVKNQTLYKRNKSNIDHSQQVIKINEIEKVLHDGHADTHSGHMGIENTYHKITRNYYWPQMWKDIEQYIKSCSICQRKGRMSKNNKMTPIKVGAPFEKIGIDLVGPLAIITNGNRYIVVAIDYMTKWAKARAIPDASAKSILPFLTEDIITRHGFPKELISNRGTTFVNQLVQEFNENAQIKHRLSTPYHPQTNGLVERLNRTLCIALAKYVQLYQEDWDKYLPMVLYAYRTMRQNTTQFEPFYLTYGRYANTPLDLILKKPNDNINEDEAIIRRACEIIDQLEPKREVALQNISKAQEKQKEYYDQNKKQQEFQIGQKVLMKNMKAQNWHHNKFGEEWLGPFYIHDVFDKGAYKLRNMDGKLLKNPYNGDHLKLFRQEYLQPLIII